MHYVPYKTSKLKVFFDGGLKLNFIAKLLLEVYAWPNFKIFRLRRALRTRFAHRQALFHKRIPLPGTSVLFASMAGVRRLYLLCNLKV